MKIPTPLMSAQISYHFPLKASLTHLPSKVLPIYEFQRKFSTENACQQCLPWPDGYQCPLCGHNQASFHSTPNLYIWFWMIFLMGCQKSGISMLSLQRMLEIKDYKTLWTMDHKIREVMAERDSYYKITRLIEVNDTHFGAPRSRK